MQFTIKNRTNLGLCNSCRHRQTVRTQFSEANLCRAFSTGPRIHMRLTKKVTECSEYTNANQPTLYEMRTTAYYLTTKGRAIGFIPWGKLSKEQQALIDDDERLE